MNRWLCVTYYKSGAAPITRTLFGEAAIEIARDIADLPYVDRVELFKYIETFS